MQALVAFSGEVPNSDVEQSSLPADHQFSETNLNPGLYGRDTRKVFDTPDYRVMIIARSSILSSSALRSGE